RRHPCKIDRCSAPAARRRRPDYPFGRASHPPKHCHQPIATRYPQMLCCEFESVVLEVLLERALRSLLLTPHFKLFAALGFDACPASNTRACKSSSQDRTHLSESNLATGRDLKANPIFQQTLGCPGL